MQESSLSLLFIALQLSPSDVDCHDDIGIGNGVKRRAEFLREYAV